MLARNALALFLFAFVCSAATPSVAKHTSRRHHGASAVTAPEPVKVQAPLPEKRDDPPAEGREQTVEEKIAPEQKEDIAPRPPTQNAPPTPRETLTSELETLAQTDTISDLAVAFGLFFGIGLILLLPDAISARLDSHNQKIFNLFRPYYPAVIFLCIAAYYVYTSDEEAVERLPWHTVMLMPAWIALFITLHPHRVALTLVNVIALLMMVSPPFGTLLWVMCLYVACRPRQFQ